MNRENLILNAFQTSLLLRIISLPEILIFILILSHSLYSYNKNYFIIYCGFCFIDAHKLN
jgi:hypothetical protein